MTRVKKTVDYIRELCLSDSREKKTLGERLKKQYDGWVETLSLEDFLAFLDAVKENKAEIGVAQFFGKFRAYAFEEYIYRLLKAKVAIPSPLLLFWGEKCLVWAAAEEEYVMEFDISIGKKAKDFVEPVIVFDAKVELDSSRLKTALASFAILKKWNPKAKCILTYVDKKLDETLLKISHNWVDGVFQFNTKNNESRAFLAYVAECLRRF